MGGEEIFGGDAEGFEECDVGSVGAAGFGAGEHLGYFALHKGFVEEAFLFRDQEFAGFIEKRLVFVRVET